MGEGLKYLTLSWFLKVRVVTGADVLGGTGAEVVNGCKKP
jgi:hypothetical protein